MYPSPALIGAPAKFESWRPQQERALDDALGSTRRFVVSALPTGSGKTLLNVAQARLMGGRMVYLTSTKGLQDQIGGDFRDMADVRGMSNYPCAVVPGLRVDEGPCHGGDYTCLVRNQCEYFAAVDAAVARPHVVTNYAYWLYAHRYGRGLGQVDTLVCDEAHAAPDELTGALRVELSNIDRRRLGMKWPAGAADGPVAGAWVTWAQSALRYGKANMDSALRGGQGPQEMRRARDLMRRLKLLAEEADKSDWIGEQSEWGWTFEPVWPARYAEALWQGVERVLLTSATVRPKALEYLGLKPSEYDFFEYPAVFPLRDRPVYYLTQSPRLTHRSSAEDLQHWVSLIDEIVGARLDRKGIIHTVSYTRAKQLLEMSKYGMLMLTHTRANTAQVLEQFRQSPAPRVLVSPSMDTGYDFPGDQCRYQVIAKLAFPDSRSPMAKARTKADKEWPYYEALTQLVQACGRGTRYPGDWCESFVVDGQFPWLLGRYRRFVPAWFASSIGWMDRHPKPRPNTA